MSLHKSKGDTRRYEDYPIIVIGNHGCTKCRQLERYIERTCPNGLDVLKVNSDDADVMKTFHPTGLPTVMYRQTNERKTERYAQELSDLGIVFCVKELTTYENQSDQ